MKNKTVMMPLSDFIKEHKKLISLLEKAKEARIRKEGRSQAKELKSVLKKYK
jgi:hypothetical protein